LNAFGEPIIGKGVGNALKIFRERGMLGKAVAVGRNKDRTVEQQMASFGMKNADDGVQIEHYDNKGRKLTMKEAFRYLCWRFHGKMPSHRKQEKMLKKLQTEGKTANSNQRMMKALEKEQKKKKQPFMVL